MKHKSLSMVFAAAWVAAISGQVAAQSHGDADRRFLVTAAQRAVADVELGRIAERKAGRLEVKTFARRMVEDQSSLNEQLTDLARAKGKTTPTELDPKEALLKSRLDGLNGEAFDRAYVGAMVSGLKREVADFKRRSVSHDGEIRDFATNRLATLRDELKVAWNIRSNFEPQRGR